MLGIVFEGGIAIARARRGAGKAPGPGGLGSRSVCGLENTDVTTFSSMCFIRNLYRLGAAASVPESARGRAVRSRGSEKCEEARPERAAETAGGRESPAEVSVPQEILPRAEGPVTLVFGTFAWREVILRWMEHARAAGCRHFRILCMDEGLAGFLRERGEGAHAVGYHEILPGAATPDLDSMERRERLRLLTPLRVKMFAHLAAGGCDFIHSDADAFWHADPRPWLMEHSGYDLLCSQGTTFPRAHYHRHRFVLCAGFFLCRANERTRGYFETVDALTRHEPDDQVCMNRALLRDPEGRWSLEQPVPAWRSGEAWVRPPLETAFLNLAQLVLRRPLLRGPVDVALRLAKRDWILTSRGVIAGRFGGGLTVGIVPMHIVARGRFLGWGDPLVHHSSRNKSP